MSLGSATRLGPYGILAPLGDGRMGEVWRARAPSPHTDDGRLERNLSPADVSDCD